MSIIAKAKEITSNILGESTNAKSIANTPEEWKALQKVKQWLEDDKQAKADFIDEMKEMNKAYMGDHWSLKGPTGKELRDPNVRSQKPNSVDNMIFTTIEGFVAEFSNTPELIKRPTEDNDEENAVALTELDKFVLNKNRINEEHQKLLRYGFKYGPFIYQDFWDPSWQGGKGPNRWVGDIRIKALHPDVLYVDARCKDDIETARRVHKVIKYPLEHFKETYPDKGKYVDEAGMNFDSVSEDEEEANGNSKTAYKIETWYKGYPLLGDKKEYGLHVITWSGDVVLKHVSYIYPEPEYPFIFKSLYDREGSIWGFGEIKQIISPQIVLNKEDEMILEGNMHQAFGQTFYEQNGIDEKQIKNIQNKGSLAGMWFPVNNPQAINRIYGQGVTTSLFNHREVKLKAIETITGRYDTTQGRIPSGITAASAIIELNSRASNRLKAKQETIKAVYQQLGEKNNNYISWYYTEQRGYRILGEDNQVKAGSFSNKQIRKVHIFADSRVMPLQQFEPGQLVENEDYEIYSPEFDTYVKYDTEMPVGKAYFIELAKELYATKIIDQQAVLYAIENGKLEPMDDILKRMQPPPQDPLQQFIASLPPNIQQQVLQMQPEQQMAFMQQVQGGDMNGHGEESQANEQYDDAGSQGYQA